MIGSRSDERARETAAKLRERAAEAGAPDVEVEGLSNEEAAGRAQTVVLAVPFRNQSENLNNLRHSLQPGTVLVDATAPLAAAIGGRATRTVGVWQGSAAQQAQEMAPRGVMVVSAFHTVSATALSDPAIEMDEDVLIAGDDRKAKDQVAELVRRIPGLRPVDCGDLEMARIVEQLTALLISVNKRYKVKHSGDQALRLARTSPLIVLLSGGTGGAKLARGLLDELGEDRLAVIANTGDDIAAFGLHVSPDPGSRHLLARRTSSTSSAATASREIRTRSSSSSSSSARRTGSSSATATSRPACSAPSSCTRAGG